MEEAKRIYESFMEKLRCPPYYKSFSQDNLEWLKKQVSDGRISDAVLRAEIRYTIDRLNEILEKSK